VFTGGLVGGFGELADQVLEQVAHLGVGDRRGVQVDLGELGDHQEKPVLLRQSGDLVLELEPLEHVDVGREPVDVVDQVRPEPVGVLGQPRQVELGGVVEAQPVAGLHHLRKQGSGLPSATKARTSSRVGSRMQSRRRRMVIGRMTLPYWCGL
jgi:hypothetical protein